MKYRPIVALLDDDPNFRKDMANLLTADMELRLYATEDDLREGLETSQPDLLLLDLDLGVERDGFHVLDGLRESGFSFPVMLLTVATGPRTTGRAVEYGIPYVNKERDMEDVHGFRAALIRAIEQHLLQAEVSYHRGRLALTDLDDRFPWPAAGMCRRLEDHARRLAREPGIVAIVGERGSGKLTAARWMHRLENGDGPLVSVTARDRDPRDLSRELYGLERGRVREPGALAAASGGSVILTGLEELPADSIQQLHLVGSTGTYTPQGTGRARRLTSKIMVTALLTDGEAGWPGSVPPAISEAWESRSLRLPPLRLRPGDLHFHAVILARMSGLAGETMGQLRNEDLGPLSEINLSGNFHDLSVAVHRGLEPLREFKQMLKKGISGVAFKELHHLGWSGAMGALETQLALSIYHEHGWDESEWARIITARSTRFKKKRLAREALEERGEL